MRHVKRYGLTREQSAQIAITGRANAALNPRALVQEPLTLDQYMAARMISEPLCLYDCDRYSDASTVLIVSAGNHRLTSNARRSGLRRRPTRWSGTAGTRPNGRGLCDRRGSVVQYGRQAEDVDTVQLYDGFSFNARPGLRGSVFAAWRSRSFIEGGKRIAFDGELPLNTFGGQIGAGRLHGFGFAHEAVVQLRGLGGARQFLASRVSPSPPRAAVRWRRRCCWRGTDMAPAFRRRILIEPSPGHVTAELEDDWHRMIVTLFHDSGIVRAVQSDMKRWPWTTCRGAIAQLEKVSSAKRCRISPKAVRKPSIARICTTLRCWCRPCRGRARPSLTWRIRVV